MSSLLGPESDPDPHAARSKECPAPHAGIFAYFTCIVFMYSTMAAISAAT
jgi:hypothetical protein